MLNGKRPYRIAFVWGERCGRRNKPNMTYGKGKAVGDDLSELRLARKGNYALIRPEPKPGIELWGFLKGVPKESEG